MKYFLLILSLIAQSVFAQSYFKEGMTWKTSFWGYTSGDPAPQYMVETVTLDGCETIDDYEALKMYEINNNTPSERNFNMYIRTDGDKVYFKLASNWYLMYDFGLKVGEGCYIYSPSYKNNNIPYKSYVKVISIGTDDQTQLPVIYFKEYDDETCSGMEMYETGAWIKGLGSLQGVNYPNGFNLDGGPINPQILEATYKDEVIYKSPTAGVSEIKDNTLNVTIDNRTLHINNIEAPCRLALYSADGIMCQQSVAEKSSASLIAPNAGTYILKVGYKTKTIVVK